MLQNNNKNIIIYSNVLGALIVYAVLLNKKLEGRRPRRNKESKDKKKKKKKCSQKEQNVILNNFPVDNHTNVNKIKKSIKY